MYFNHIKSRKNYFIFTIDSKKYNYEHTKQILEHLVHPFHRNKGQS